MQASVIASRSWGGSFHIDVQAKDPTATGSKHNITLYIVDYERWGASQVIKAMDLTTLKTVAPMALITPADFVGGTYVTYTYTGGSKHARNPHHNMTVLSRDLARGLQDMRVRECI